MGFKHVFGREFDSALSSDFNNTPAVPDVNPFLVHSAI